MPSRELSEVRPGQAISAEWANALVAEVRRLRRIVGAGPIEVSESEAGIQISLAREIPRLDYVELDDTLEPGDFDGSATRLRFDASDDDRWLSGAGELDAVADPLEGLLLEGERHLTFSHSGSGKRIPVPALQFHLGKVDSAIEAGAAGAVSVWRVDEGTAVDSTFNVEARDWLGGSLASGTKVYLFQHRQSRLWYAIQATAGSDGKVKVNSGDTLDFLEDQLANHTSGVYSSSGDLLIKTETSSGKIRHFVDVSTIAGFSSSGVRVLVTDAGIPTFASLCDLLKLAFGYSSGTRVPVFSSGACTTYPIGSC